MLGVAAINGFANTNELGFGRTVQTAAAETSDNVCKEVCDEWQDLPEEVEFIFETEDNLEVDRDAQEVVIDKTEEFFAEKVRKTPSK